MNYSFCLFFCLVFLAACTASPNKAPIITISSPQAINQASDNVGDINVPDEDRPAPEDEVIGLGSGWGYITDENNAIFGAEITGSARDADGSIKSILLTLVHDASDGALNLHNEDVTAYVALEPDNTFNLQLTRVFRDKGLIPQTPLPKGPFNADDGEPAADIYELPLCIYLEPENAQAYIIAGLAGKFLGNYTLSMFVTDNKGLASQKASLSFEVWCAPVINGDGRIRPSF